MQKTIELSVGRATVRELTVGEVFELAGQLPEHGKLSLSEFLSQAPRLVALLEHGAVDLPDGVTISDLPFGDATALFQAFQEVNTPFFATLTRVLEMGATMFPGLASPGRSASSRNGATPTPGDGPGPVTSL